MQIGVTYPHVELRAEPAATRSFVIDVEELGFDHLLVYDHVVGVTRESTSDPLRYAADDTFHDPFVVLAHLAALTSRLNLVTGILVLPQRQTVLVAKQASDLARLSSGRLRLGVGVGWNRHEYDALGESFADRGDRLTEQIEVLRLLWAETSVTFHGRFHRLESMGLGIRPTTMIPLLCGGSSPAALRRAAALADGFIFPGSVAEPLAMLRELGDLLDMNGRERTDFEFHLNITDPDRTAREIVEVVHGWAAAGGTHVSVSSMHRGFKAPGEHLDFLAEVLAGSTEDRST